MSVMNYQSINQIILLICLLITVCLIPALAADENEISDISGLGTSTTILPEPSEFTVWPEAPVVDITGINAVNFPQVMTYVTVNTPEGRAGELTAEDFEIYENGALMDISSVKFPDSSTRTKLDLAIVFDESGSMSEEIAGLKIKVKELTDSIADANIDCRYALISFRDEVTVRQGWTSSPSVLKSAIETLEASGGDDAPEANLDAIEAVLKLGFRPDAQHMIIDITDSTTHYRDDGTSFSNYIIPETAEHLLSNGTSYILVGPSSVSGQFTVHTDKKELVKALGGSGLFIDIHSNEFSKILGRIQSIITQTYTIGYQTSQPFVEGRKATVEVRVGSESGVGEYTIVERSAIPDSSYEERELSQFNGRDDALSTFGASIVDITGINAVNFPYIISYVTVNTPVGRAGGLIEDDFQVFEGGKLMDITSFTFTDSSSPTTLDLVIVFDDTGSMQDEIDGLKEKVLDLTDRISSASIDCRYALISFKDTVTVRQEWTSEPSVIKTAVDGLVAIDGFDAPEANLDAIEAALALGFRPDAQHMIIDITDSTTHYRNDGTPFSQSTIAETALNLISNGTSFILVGPTEVTGAFDSENDKRELVKALGGSGLFIDIHSDDFLLILESIQGVITQTYTIGYYTPDLNADGARRTVMVQVTDDADSGQYIARVSSHTISVE